MPFEERGIMQKLLWSIALVLISSTPSYASLFGNSEEIKALRQELVELKIELKNTQEKLSFTENAFSSLEEDYNNTKLELSVLKLRYNSTSEAVDNSISYKAYLDPVSSNYSVITTPGSRIAVSCDNIKAYASGSRVTLEFVNFYSVDIHGVKAHIIASPDILAGSLDDFENNKRTIDEKIGDISSGSAKKVTVSIPDLPPDKIKTLEITLSEEGIGYKKAK